MFAKKRLSGVFRLLLFASMLYAQFLFGEQQPANVLQYEIRSIDFEGNDAFSNSELMQLLETKETPGFLSKTLHGMFEALGRPDEFLEFEVLSDDMKRLRQHYLDHGFQEVSIDTSLSFHLEKGSVEILFSISEGYQSIIDSMVYRGIVGPYEGGYDAIKANPKIEAGDPFNKALLEEEVKRVLEILNNEGYPKAEYLRESSSGKYYTSSRNYRIVLVFALRRFYRFGDITVVNEQAATRDDIDSIDVLRQLDYKPEGHFNQDAIRTSERNLNRTGVFDLARVSVLIPPDTAPPYVPSTVRVRPKEKHELAPEISFSDENSDFNLGVGLGYSNRNFFGGARTASTRVRFRTATLDEFPDFFKLNSNAVANLDVTFELLQPYVFTNKVKGGWSLSWIRDKRELYVTSIFQNKFSFGVRFAEFTTGYLDWTLQFLDLKKRDGIVDSTDAERLRQLDDLNAQAKEIQFNSILSFTIQRDMTNDIFSPSTGFNHSFTVEESGVLPLVLKTDPRRFTQFYRSSFMLRWYFTLSGENRFSILAFKLKGGFEEKYGDSRRDTSRAIPQTHRFYAGGGGSVRGWGSRSLSAVGNSQLGGDLLAEASVEMRINVLQGLRDDIWSKLWTVLFIDVGNVWAETKDLQLRSAAIAAGFGIRYDTFFGPFRIDYGFRVYDPRASVNPWITERRFWGETFRVGVIHFGIGHAF